MQTTKISRLLFLHLGEQSFPLVLLGLLRGRMQLDLEHRASIETEKQEHNQYCHFSNMSSQ